MTNATATVTANVSAATAMTNSSLASIKAFAANLDGFKADFDRRKKSEWLAAIARYEAAKVTVNEVIEPIATETVEPIALVVEATAVKAHAAVTSPQAINGYQFALRGVIWCGVAIVLVVGLAYTLAALAWDAIDGEPAIAYWVKSYSKTPQGRRVRSVVLKQYQAARTEVVVVGAPFVARAKEVRAIVRVGGQRVLKISD